MDLAAKLGDNIRKLRHRRKSSVASHWYLPIDTYRGEIRLLHLLPGEWNDVISVYTSKARVPLEDLLASGLQRPARPAEPAPLIRSYEALSYTWGSKENSVEIILDGKFGFLLTRNLWLALRRLRHEDDIRLLWIDAICINQENSEERSAQIQLMGLIFKIASKVTVWLGECFDCEECIGATEHNVNFYEEASHALQMAVRNTTPSWWTRAWVVQEFVSASETPVVQFGPYCIDWVTLGILSSHLITQMGANSSATSLPAAQYDIEKARALVKQGKGTLFQLLLILGELQATDDRDTVYSLLGMIDNSEARTVDANYTDSTVTAFAKATYASIRSSKSYDIMMLISFSATASRPPDLPSWAFDFAFGGDRKIKIDDYTLVVGGRIAASINDLLRCEALPWTLSQATRTNEIAADFHAPDMTLALHGLDFDTVAVILDTTEHVSPGGLHYMKAPQFYARLQDLLKDFPTGDPYGALSAMPSRAGQPSPEAFATGLLQMLDHLRRSNDDVHFQDWLKVVFHNWWELAGNSRGKKAEYPLLRAWFNSLQLRRMPAAVFLTRCGFLGVASGNIKTGDNIALLTGCLNPAMLRHAENGRYTFQGFAYVHGIMDGELLVAAPRAQLPEQRFVLT